jgi:hypothetical protein
MFVAFLRGLRESVYRCRSGNSRDKTGKDGG